jgi:hypothetical protein
VIDFVFNNFAVGLRMTVLNYPNFGPVLGVLNHTIEDKKTRYKV